MYFQQNNAFNETNYKRYKNKLIKIAERYQYQKEFDNHKSDLKKMWQMLREIIGKKTSSQQKQKFLINGTLTRDSW